jgi:hypothetical protein
LQEGILHGPLEDLGAISTTESREASSGSALISLSQKISEFRSGASVQTLKGYTFDLPLFSGGDEIGKKYQGRSTDFRLCEAVFWVPLCIFV